jgi:hypothetical protein
MNCLAEFMLGSTTGQGAHPQTNVTQTDYHFAISLTYNYLLFDFFSLSFFSMTFLGVHPVAASKPTASFPMHRRGTQGDVFGGLAA